MDYLTSVTLWMGDPATQEMMIILFISGAIFVFALGVSYFVVGTSNPVKRRMALIDVDQYDDNEDDPGRKLITLDNVFGSASEWLIPTSEIERSKTTKALTYAGFRSPRALQSFYEIKAILFVALPALTYMVIRWFPELTNTETMYALAIAAAIGLFGPNNILERRVEKRLKKLRDGFPDALDLLVVCVESGLGLSAAIQRVSDEIAVSHEELARELALVNAETRAGMDRAKALRNLADRTGLDDIRGLVSMLVQAMRFGTSIADTLRVYSEEFRDRRMQKAEEMAAIIGTKLLFPLVLCMFPSFFAVAIGPAVIGFMEVFAQL
jgi:tight adherence protein C